MKKKHNIFSQILKKEIFNGERSIMKHETDKTIADFSDQWVTYQNNEGYYASKELFTNICGPLLSAADLKNSYVAEIGSGTGRIVNMLLEFGVNKIIAIEPSEGFDILKKNTFNHSKKIEYLKCTGEEIPSNLNLDYIFSIGVLHHIKDPYPVVKAAYESLKSGGKMLVWLYGHENNRIYLKFIMPIRRITTRLPHFLLAGFSHIINLFLDIYIFFCKIFPLPMRQYCINIISKFTRKKRFLVIYDQLNPKYAKYYKEEEAKALLESAGFKDVKLYHRLGYSWTVIGTKKPNY